MSAINYTDGNTVAERAYGREQDRLFEAYENTDPEACKLKAEEEATDDLFTELWQAKDIREIMLDHAEDAVCRLAAFAVHPDLLPASYKDNGYQRDSERVKNLIDDWIEDRAEQIRRGEV